ncbi:MAG: lipoyl domain-containing protein [Armatimonadetes bacterium]|nr:lipoyl domain-containing protein [Armatimonadota bacterium]
MAELLRIEQWAENLREVTMGRWLKAEGEPVDVGEPLCEIITEKVTFEYESPVSGVLLRVYAPEKSVIPVGYIFGCVGEVGEQPPAGVEEENARLLDQHLAQGTLDLDLDLEPGLSGPGSRVRATPAARRAARQAGVSLADVAAWVGQSRPITDADVEAFIRGRHS